MKNKIKTIATALENPCRNNNQGQTALAPVLIECLFERLVLDVQLLNRVNTREEYECLEYEIRGILKLLSAHQLNFLPQENDF